MTIHNSIKSDFAIDKGLFGEDFIWGVSDLAPHKKIIYRKDTEQYLMTDELIENEINRKNELSIGTANFYVNYKDDIALIKQLGIPNYKFSITWSRIFPEGIGATNQAGIDYYNAVIDTCIANGIEPFITLFHCDLPLPLEGNGGWSNRDIIYWFTEYVTTCVHAFKDRVKNWIIFNEPSTFTGVNYFLGLHPFEKKGLHNFLPTLHHALLCQSIGYKVIKKIDDQAFVGTSISCVYITPKAYSEKDIKASGRVDALINRLFIEPSLGMGYPIEELVFLKGITKYIKKGDDELLKAEFDFIGLQNYTREVIEYNSYAPYLNAKIVSAKKRNVERTNMDWEIYPKAIFNVIKKFTQYEGIKKIIITENGASFADEYVFNKVNDSKRISYLQGYLKEVLNAKQDNSKVTGYFIGSLVDDCKGLEEHQQRFGLIHLDFSTQKRTIKNSGYWYSHFLSDKIKKN
jgi:beta-glucosidase